MIKNAVDVPLAGAALGSSMIMTVQTYMDIAVYFAGALLLFARLYLTYLEWKDRKDS